MSLGQNKASVLKPKTQEQENIIWNRILKERKKKYGKKINSYKYGKKLALNLAAPMIIKLRKNDKSNKM